MSKQRPQQQQTAELNSADARSRITTDRAGRLYKLLQEVARGAVPRNTLLNLLNVGLRTFYRDIDTLRTCGIEIATANDGYTLEGSLDRALNQLPFPDPELTFGEVLHLMKGRTKAHLRLQQYFELVVR